MANNNPQNQNMANADNNSLQLSDYLGIFLPKWYWFVISIVIVLMVAGLYLARTPFVYTRYAELLVNDDKKGGTNALAASEFSDMGLFAMKNNIVNELTTLKSPQLMTEVVTRLSLNENFSVRQGLKNVTMYKQHPVEIYIQDSKVPDFSMTIELKDSINFVITDFWSKDIKKKLTFKGVIGSPVETPLGIIALSRSEYYSPDQIGVKFNYSHGNVNNFAEAYAKKLVAELTAKEGTIIKLKIDDESPVRAEDVLNTLIEVYNEDWVKDKNRISISTSQFISERLHVIESELGNVDANISSFKSSTLAPDLEAASQLYMQQSAEAKKEMMAITTQLTTAQLMRQELASKDITQPLPTNSGLDNTNIAAQVAEYNKAVLDRNRLYASSSEQNPLVQDLKVKILAMQQSIIQSVDNYITSLRQQLDGIQRIDAVATSKLASNPDQAKYLLSVERQQKVKEALYLYLLQKREENELSQAFTAYNTRVITAPRGSVLPTSPQKMKILLIAFVIALVLPGALLIFIESNNTKVRGRVDLKDLSVPFIGEIPLSAHLIKQNKSLFARFSKKRRKRNSTTNDIVIAEGKRDVQNEAFRVLRSNLDFMSSSNDGKNVIVLTSFNPGSGKTFISMNLCISFAIKQKKVLIIDGDLRHGSTSAYFGSLKAGLSDYLSGKTDDLKSLMIVPEKYPTLSVLPIGKIPPNPTELLENGRLAKIIEQMSDQFDYIFIDCPPIDIVADTQIIEKYADRTLFVIRAGLLERAMLKELENIYNNKRFKNLALILNGTESARHRYGYKYGYRYGYYGGDKKSYYSNE